MRAAYLALAGLDETRRRRAVNWLLSRIADDEAAERATAPAGPRVTVEP